MSAEQKSLEFIEEHLEDAVFPDQENSDPNAQKPEKEEPPLEPLPCDSFKQLAECFAKDNYWTKSMEQALAVLCAVNISVNIGGELLWCYLVGPSSSGKSMLCDAIAAAKQYSKSLGKITGIHSGYKIGKSKKDHSVLKMINGKCAIWKDWTSVLTLPEATLENIYGELRDIYDGSTNATYRTEIKREYHNVRFSIIAGTTYEILRHSRSHLGERFFSVDLSDETHGSHKHVKTGLRHVVGGMQASYAQGTDRTVHPDRMLTIKRTTLGFLDHLHNKMRTCKPVHVSDAMLDRFTESARFIARIRGRVVREGSHREVAYRPRPEVAIRLGGQFAKTGMCLATVLNKPEVDDEVFELVTKVAVDTAHGTNYEIIEHLMDCHDEGLQLGLDAGQIAAKIGYLKADSIKSKLEDMSHLKIVRHVKVPNRHNVRGRHRHLWEVLPSTRGLWNGLHGRNS